MWTMRRLRPEKASMPVKQQSHTGFLELHVHAVPNYDEDTYYIWKFCKLNT